MNSKIVGLYSFFLIVFSIFSYIFIDSNLIYLKRVYTGFDYTYASTITVFYFFLVVFFYVFYILFLKMILKKKIGFHEVIFLTIISCFLLLLSYPAMLSHDIFNYIATAKVLYFYTENPYIVMPIEFIGDPLFSFIHAANKLALYGPGWIFLTAIPYILGFSSFVGMLFSFKIFVAFFYFGIVQLLWKITKNVFSISAFALNPLVLIETFVSGHNDVVMMFLALLGIHLALQKKLFLSLVFILLSILIKYATLFLLPVYVYILWGVITKRQINSQKVYFLSAVAMMTIFLLSPLREEIYPWYALWFLPFAILSGQKHLITISLALSFSLLLRYIPFMAYKTHFGSTPILKIVLTIVPTVCISTLFFIREKQWRKIFS